MFRLTAARNLANAARPMMARYATPKAAPIAIAKLNNNNNNSCFGFAQKLQFYSTLPKEDVAKRVIDVVKNFDKIAPTASISAETTFINDLGLDSLDTVEVLVAIEEEFDIEINDKDADEIKTVGQAIEYIAAHPDAN